MTTCTHCPGVKAYARGLCWTHYQEARIAGTLPDARIRKDCSIDGCDRPHAARGYCKMHWQRAKREGNLPGPQLPTPKPCTVTDCDKPSHARGLCRVHYFRERYSKTGEPRPTRGQCTFPGCDREHQAKGLCRAHYQQTLNGVELHELFRPRVKVAGVCQFPDCGREHRAMGYCVTHYSALRKGRELAPIGLPREKKPRTRKPYQRKEPKPANILPPGWDRVTPKREIPKPNGSEIRMDGPVVIPPGLLASARRVLEQHDALDLADMLGLAAA